VISDDENYDGGAQLPRAEDFSGEQTEAEMSTSITNAQRLRAIHAHGTDQQKEHPPRSRMVHWVAAAAVFFGTTGVTLTAIEVATPLYLKLNSFAAASFIIAAIAGAVLCVEWMLADRQTFYLRGKVDGYYQGWHGQLPDADDPLLRP
jgi:magnesium-transporting ATPase (P-type)